MSKKQPKVTEWFPATVKPVRVGHYQRNWGDGSLTEVPDYWDGKHWFNCDIDGSHDGCRSLDESRPWRGLAAKP